MKKSQLLFYLLLVVACCSFQAIKKRPSDAEEEGLKGKVKQVKQHNYKAEMVSGAVVQGAECKAKGIRNYLKKYNEQGNTVIWQNYKLNDTLDFYMLYKHTEKGELLVQTYLADGTLWNWYIYDNYFSTTSKGSTTYRQDGTVSGTLTWKYDSNGNVSEAIEEKAGSPINRSTLKYDDRGNEIECTLYNPDGSVSWIYRRKYDDKNNKTEDRYYDFGGKFLNSKTTYTYDKFNNLTEEKQYNAVESPTSTTTYTYEYDKQNNWVKKIESDNGVPTLITTREINYYE